MNGSINQLHHVINCVSFDHKNQSFIHHQNQHNNNNNKQEEDDDDQSLIVIVSCIRVSHDVTDAHTDAPFFVHILFLF